MDAIRIRKHLDSETLHLPELKPLIGKTVEIVVQVVIAPAAAPDPWTAWNQLAGTLKDYDFDAYRKQREFDRKHAEDHLR
jgi:hypothetical protein